MLVFGFLCSSFSSALANVEHYGQPRIDEAFMKVIQNPDAATSAFQQCEVEFLPDMIRWANIRKLINENQIVLASPGYHYCYIAFNCRSYVPDDYGQPTAGRSLAPLNWTDFRQALLWAGLSRAEKEAAILQIYGGPIVTALDTPVPPSLGIWYWMPPTYPGCNYTMAREYLEASGFYILGGLLYQPNGVVVRNTINVLSPAGSPTSVAFTQKFVDKWNDFMFNFLGVTNCNFVNNPVDFGTVLLPRAFDWRDFDCCLLDAEVGRFPDYLYDFFHSSQDYPGSNNAPGVKDAALDHDLEVVKWGLNETEQLEHCYDAQRLLVFEDCPTIELYSRTYFTAFKNYTYYGAGNKYLANPVSQKGVGADNRWTWGLMHWSDSPTGGTVKYVLGSNLVHLHPGWATSESEWDVLNRIEDGLMTTDLEMADLPNIACKWTVVPFDWAPLNIYSGTKVTFQIRSDVLWHDLHPVDVYDIKFALDFLRNFPRYGPIYQYLMWSQIVDPCTIDIYLNTTSQWILYDLASVALLFPLHMYGCTFTVAGPLGEDITYHYSNGWLATHGYNPVTAAVGTIAYTVGEARKALIGCGPYVFDYWDPATSTVRVIKFQHYWVDGPVKANIIQPQRVDPCAPFQFYVEIVNAGSKDGITGELVPFVIDSIEVTADGNVVFVIPGPIMIAPFGYVVLGPYEWHFDRGFHHMDCHIYGYGELYESYECPMWVTVKQDVNLDFYVSVEDVNIALAAFNSQPPPYLGYERWDERCDMDGDYYIGITDIFDIGASVDSYHNVAITSVATSKTGCLPIDTVGQGYICRIQTTAKNKGNFTETFNVTAYATNATHSLAIGSSKLTLNPNDTAALTFVWSTSGIAKGNYTIKTAADIVLNELSQHTSDNNLTYGTIMVTLVGDVNPVDGYVGIDDIYSIASNFGHEPINIWDPTHDPNYDIIEDYFIGIDDIFTAAQHFAEEDP
jgi:ABC-type transport system substrate-binding protein